MEQLIIYKREYDSIGAIDNFMSFYYSLNMKYLASDLLKQGLTPFVIERAFTRAIKIARSSGLELEKHFLPVYSQLKGTIVRDCKLSKLGYAMVLLNADPNYTAVGKWQLKVLKAFLN